MFRTELNRVEREAFLRAAAFGDIEVVHQYIVQNKGNKAAMNVVNGAGLNALYLAVLYSQTQIVASLLSQNIMDVNVANLHGDTALFIAASNGDAEITKALLGVEGIQVNVTSILSRTPLKNAAARGYVDVVKLLFAAGAFVDQAETFLTKEVHAKDAGSTYQTILALFAEHNERNKRSAFLANLKASGCEIRQDDAKAVYLLQSDTYERFSNMISKLKMNRQLTGESFSNVLTRLSPPLLQTLSNHEEHKASLADLTWNELMALGDRRLQLLVSSLDYLNQIHTSFRLHGDITPEHCLVNTATGEMTFADSPHTRPVSSNKSTPIRKLFSDRCLHPQNTFAFDMYAFGYVIAALFPELYAITLPEWEFEQAEICMKKIPSSLAPVEQAIVHLVTACMDEQPANRCTSEQALAFCKGILQADELLDDQSLQTLLLATIDHSTTTAEDVLRESKRAGRFC